MKTLIPMLICAFPLLENPSDPAAETLFRTSKYQTFATITA